MARLLISLADGADGEIELLDNPFIDFWKMVFQRNIKRHAIRTSYHSITEFVGGVYAPWTMRTEDYQTDEVLEFKQQRVNRINRAVDGLLEEGVVWTRGKANMHIDNEVCNRLHRGFTTLIFTHLWTDHIPMTSEQVWRFKKRCINMNAHNCWPAQFYEVEGFEMPENHRPDLNDTEKVERAYAHLHEINACVHDIEDVCLYNKRKLTLVEDFYKHYDVQMALEPKLDWNAKQADGTTDSCKLDWNFDSALGEAFQSIVPGIDQGCNVWDLKNILGKDYEKCYEDNDNPLNIDITNTVGTTKGGFQINGAIHSRYNNILKPWLKNRGCMVEPERFQRMMYYPIPVGKIDERFIKQHFTIKGGFDQGVLDKNKMLVSEEMFDIASKKRLVGVELIE